MIACYYFFRNIFVVIFLWCLAIHLASAFDVLDLSALDNPRDHDKPFEGSAQLGYTGNSGNSDAKTLNTAVSGTWYHKKWAYSAWASANSASTNHRTSAESYNAGNRIRFNLSKKHFLFGNLLWQSNRFAGYRSRTALIGGYGRQIINSKRQTLSWENGLGLRNSRTIDHQTDNRIIGYSAIDYSYQLSANARFTQGLSIQAATDNTASTANSTLSVSVNNRFSLKLTYTIENNSHLPMGSRDKTDTTTTIALVYGL